MLDRKPLNLSWNLICALTRKTHDNVYAKFKSCASMEPNAIPYTSVFSDDYW